MIGRVVLFLFLAAVLYGSVCLYLYLTQDKIIFHPEPSSEEQRREGQWRWLGNRSILKAPDGLDVEVFFLHRGDRLPLLIYFGGNALEAGSMVAQLSRLKGFNLLLWNYPGFGGSQGRPSEKLILSHALFVYDSFKERAGGCDGVYLVGRSLGTAVATYVASRRCCKALALVTPFDSLVSLARWQYPFVPVGLLLKHRFDSKQWIARVSVPVLVVLAEHDSVVPHRFSMSLIEGLDRVEVDMVPGVDHGSIGDSPILYEKLEAFWNGMDAQR